MLSKSVKAVILAAGKGTRLAGEGTDLPKVMRLAAGKPLLAHVLNALDFIPRKDCVIVVGYKREAVMEAFPDCVFAVQEQQLGTGHAAMAGLGVIENYEGPVLLCYGDMPLVKRETYEALIKEHLDSGNACTLLSGIFDEQLPYGRIVRDENGAFHGIVEDRDCTPEQKAIKELNVGIYVFDAAALRSVLSEIKNDNVQGEYYLTDAPLLLVEKGLPVGVCCRRLGDEIIGVNTLEQLRQVEELLLK